MNTSENYTIKQISSKDTYIVRHPVLRKDKPIASCAFIDDNKHTTIHLGLFFNTTLIGVASFLKNKNTSFPQTKQYQLRGMGILKKYQGKGCGKLILSYGEKLLKSKNTNLIWCNARESALNFYKSNGYTSIGDTFIIPNVGPHYVMFKPL